MANTSGLLSGKFCRDVPLTSLSDTRVAWKVTQAAKDGKPDPYEKHAEKTWRIIDLLAEIGKKKG